MSNFKCPDCGHDELEEVLTEATISSVVENFDEDGTYVEYDEKKPQEIYGGVIDRFQCRCCGHVVKDVNEITINTYDDLYPVAKEKGWI